MSLFSSEVINFLAVSTAVTAGVAYAIYWILNDSPISRWLHDSDAVVPSFLSITAFIFGLTVSTLAGYCFDRHQAAISNLISESAAIDTFTNTSTTLSSQDQLQIHAGVQNYINAVVQKEWPALNQKDYERKDIALPEFIALSKIINRIAYASNQRSSVEGQLESALASIRESRKVRQSLAYENDNIKKWISIPISSILLLLSVGIVHLGSLKAMKVSLLIASICVITAMVFLFICFSPYGEWNPVQPIQLQESLRLLDSFKPNQ